MKYAVEANPDKNDMSVMLLSVVNRSFSASFSFTLLTKSTRTLATLKSSFLTRMIVIAIAVTMIAAVMTICTKSHAPTATIQSQLILK